MRQISASLQLQSLKGVNGRAPHGECGQVGRREPCLGALAPEPGCKLNNWLGERILARSVGGHDASEATLGVLARQMQQIEPLDADELASAIAFRQQIDTQRC